MKPDAVEHAIEEHWDAMRATCVSILRENGDEAAEVMSQAVANVWATPPPAGCANVRAWLCQVARNATYSFLRKKKVARVHLAPLDSVADRALPDQFLASDLSQRLGQLFGRAREFLGEDSWAWIDRYLKAELGQRTEAMSAEEETAIRKQLGDALFATLVVDAPGEAPSRCGKPAKIAKGKTRSPELLEEIMAHVVKCAICRRERKKPKGLLALALALLGVTVNMSTGKKVGVALLATAAAAAVTIVGVTQLPYAAPLEAETLLPVPVSPSPPSLPPPLPAPPRQVPPSAPHAEPPPVPAVSVESPAPSSPPSSPPAESSVVESVPPEPVERDDSPPTISDGWLERGEIAGGACHDEPTTSKVRAVVTASSGIAAVTAHLRESGRDMAFPLTRGGRAWHGSIGPVPDEDGRFDVVITAVGANELRSERRIGSIRVTCCAAGYR